MRAENKKYVWYPSLFPPSPHLSDDIVCEDRTDILISCFSSKQFPILLHSGRSHGTSSVPVLLAGWLWVLANYKSKGLGFWLKPFVFHVKSTYQCWGGGLKRRSQYHKLCFGALAVWKLRHLFEDRAHRCEGLKLFCMLNYLTHRGSHCIIASWAQPLLKLSPPVTGMLCQDIGTLSGCPLCLISQKLSHSPAQTHPTPYFKLFCSYRLIPLASSLMVSVGCQAQLCAPQDGLSVLLPLHPDHPQSFRFQLFLKLCGFFHYKKHENYG